MSQVFQSSGVSDISDLSGVSDIFHFLLPILPKLKKKKFLLPMFATSEMSETSEMLSWRYYILLVPETLETNSGMICILVIEYYRGS